MLEAAAVGIPDHHYGQEIGVCIVLRAACSCTPQKLHAFSATVLGRYKAPSHYRFAADLPRGPSGKVPRLKLLAPFPS